MSKHLYIFIMFTAAYFLSFFYRSANAVIAPDLSRELSLGAAELGFMTSVFFASFALVQLPLGIGLDRWGPRWVTPGLMLVGAAGSLIFAIAPSFAILAVGRALIGVGMAGVLMGSLKTFSQWFPPHRFATVSGFLVGIGSSGALIAATPLAWLNNTVGWRAVFASGTAVIIIVALSIMIWARNTPPGVDWLGGKQASNNLNVVFGEIKFWRIAPHTLTMTGMLLGFQGLWAGPYLFDVMQLNEIEVGNIMLLLGLGVIIGFAAFGWLADRFGLARTIVGSSIVFILCQFALVVSPPLAVVSVIYVLFGFSGGANIVLLAHIRQVFPASITGQAVTAVNLFGIGGTFLLQWLMGVIIGSFTTNTAGHYPPQAYASALLITAVASSLTLVWYLPLLRKG